MVKHHKYVLLYYYTHIYHYYYYVIIVNNVYEWLDGKLDRKNNNTNMCVGMGIYYTTTIFVKQEPQEYLVT